MLLLKEPAANRVFHYSTEIMSRPKLFSESEWLHFTTRRSKVKIGLKAFGIGWCLANRFKPFFTFIYQGMDGEIKVASNFVKGKEAASYSKAAATLMFVVCFILVFCSVSGCLPLKMECDKSINNWKKVLNCTQCRQIIVKENGFNRRTFVNYMPWPSTERTAFSPFCDENGFLSGISSFLFSETQNVTCETE